MCLLILSKGVKIEKYRLENAFKNNSDGAGFAYAIDNKLNIQKGFFDFDSFYSEYVKVPEGANTIIHFRATSRGLTSEDNCHPFMVNGGLCFAHNGTIHEVENSNIESDTYKFNEDVLKPILGKKMFLPAIFPKVLEKFIGKSNKLVFLNYSGKFYIINESEGHWIKDVWFSNYSYSYIKSSKAIINCTDKEKFPTLMQWLRKAMGYKAHLLSASAE